MKCCDYTAGMLQEPVTFQRLTLTTDGIGGSTKAWASVAGAPARAHVRPVSGNERLAAARIDAEVSLRVTVRYFAGLRESDSVLIRGRRHNITFINNVEFQNRWLELTVSAGVAV